MATTYIVCEGEKEHLILKSLLEGQVDNANIKYEIGDSRSSVAVIASTLINKTYSSDDKLVVVFDYDSESPRAKYEVDSNLRFIINYGDGDSQSVKMCGFAPALGSELNISKSDDSNILKQINENRSSLLQNDNVKGMIEFING